MVARRVENRLLLVTAGAVQIAIVRRGGQGERTLTPLTENSELPAWSPDGSLIAFSRGFEGRRTIWTMKPDGSDAHRITEPGSDDVAPAWSPDGRYIVFARRQRLMIMRADGSAVRSLSLSGSLPGVDVMSPIGFAVTPPSGDIEDCRPGLTSHAQAAQSGISRATSPPAATATLVGRRGLSVRNSGSRGPPKSTNGAFGGQHGAFGGRSPVQDA